MFCFCVVLLLPITLDVEAKTREKICERTLKKQVDVTIRVGLGYDAHRLVRGRALFLGGAKIPSAQGLAGHSDADVICHAIVDALLGSAGLPDIGSYFSDTDPRWKNVSSLLFLKEVAKIFSRRKVKIINIDCILLAESPKIFPYIGQMKKNISTALKIKSTAIGLKASSNEKMGFIGRKQGMAAMAVALISAGSRG